MECIELMIGEIENLKLDSSELSIMSLPSTVWAIHVSERDEQDYLCFSMILLQTNNFLLALFSHWSRESSYTVTSPQRGNEHYGKAVASF